MSERCLNCKHYRRAKAPLKPGYYGKLRPDDRDPRRECVRWAEPFYVLPNYLCKFWGSKDHGEPADRG
jgi:hypothetical protein